MIKIIIAAIISSIALAVSPFFLSPAATAATGDMNEVLRINDTPTVVKIFETAIQAQLWFVTGKLPFNDMAGAADTTSPANTINISLNQMDGLRTQSILAPLVAIATDTVQFMSTPAYEGYRPPFMTMDKEVCLVGATTKGFVDPYKIVVTDSDRHAMERIVIDEFNPSDVVHQTVVSSFTLGMNRGNDACGIDVSKI